MKDKIRPFYTEIQGYYKSQLEIKSGIYSKEIWTAIDSTIDDLNSVSGKDYNKFKLQSALRTVNGHHFLDSDIFLLKLGGLISRLFGEYFENEQAPFQGMPSTIINQNTSQSQNVQVSILLEIQSKIDDSLSKTTDENEKGFLNEVKSKLATVQNVAQLLNLIFMTADKFNIAITALKRMFSL